ncbi:unnamed protein product [Didymodactylos carnosus]|uniref:Uncharacterized protein n=1 Tax=Didymodactylos carnosus TaxID=1234261 RepID=A0A814MQ34_9BILA|nr:unnamed protein product [Didymodactylos carnosus]CAF3848669.1 unnamed protein product [Didymodactylos carnosus]
MLWLHGTRLLHFKYAWKQVFPQKKPFPVSNTIISDRYFVLLRASLHQFNNESYEGYLQRIFKIIDGHTSPEDKLKTKLHACLSHMMMYFRKKLVNKLVIAELREIAMWCLSLLVNTSIWNEMLENWRLICIVFINYFSTSFPSTTFKLLATKIMNLKRVNPSFHLLMEESKNTNGITQQNEEVERGTTRNKSNKDTDPHDFDDDVNINAGETEEILRKTKNYNDHIYAIFNEQTQLETINSGYSTRFLKYLLKWYMPSVILWSDLLIKPNVQQSNAQSEWAMSIAKIVHLGGLVHGRLDAVLDN